MKQISQMIPLYANTSQGYIGVSQNENGDSTGFDAIDKKLNPYDDANFISKIFFRFI